MKCPIRFGKLNIWHFCILLTVALKFLNSLISGISLSKENHDDKFYLFGSKPIFIEHPFIQSSFSFFGIFLLGLFFYIIKKIVRKKIYKEEGLLEIKKNEKNSENGSNKSAEKESNCELFKESIPVILIFVFAILSLSIYDSLGFNDIKIWPLEYLILYFFSKKYLDKVLYKHQKLALFLILIPCIALCVTTSFMRDGIDKYNKNYNIYDKVMSELGWIFIPIIMILYLISMIAISYGMVKIKYLIDIKFIDTYIILMVLGILGFLLSSILAIISTFIQCVGNDSIHVENICKITFNDKLYFDSFLNYFQSLKDHFSFEIFLALPFFQLINALISLFNVLIIKELDPFYLILIRSLFYFIYRTINFVALSHTSIIIIKFVFHQISNLFSVICSLIYLEVIILTFNDYDKDVKECIIDRGKIDEEKAKEEEPSKLEISINGGYAIEIQNSIS